MEVSTGLKEPAGVSLCETDYCVPESIVRLRPERVKAGFSAWRNRHRKKSRPQ
jgi:hypothetical protein